MKIHIDIDCTPEEDADLMGLPDVAPMQDAVMKEMQDRMMAAMRSMDPETLMKTWLPAGISNLEQMQKAFWQQFGGGDQGPRRNSERSDSSIMVRRRKMPGDPAPYYEAHVFCCVNERPEGHPRGCCKKKGLGSCATT